MEKQSNFVQFLWVQYISWQIISSSQFPGNIKVNKYHLQVIKIENKFDTLSLTVGMKLIDTYIKRTFNSQIPTTTKSN